MNKEMLLVATGVGIGALMFTDQGKKLVQATMNGGSILPALESVKGEGHKDASEGKDSMSGNDDDPFGRKHKDKDEE